MNKDLANPETRRRYLMDRLAAARAELVAQLVGVDEATLTQRQDFDEWTAKDVLAHIAAWDRWQHRTMKCMVDGQEPNLSAEQDADATNAIFVAQWQDRSLTEVVTELQTARSDWLAWLESLSDGEFFERRSYSGKDWSFDGQPVQIMWTHDAQHAHEFAAWREAHQFGGQAGPKAVLVAGLEAARAELLTAAALVPVKERITVPVVGEWTLKELLGHIADWEWLDLEGLRYMAAGGPPQVELITDLDAWNAARVADRRDQTWAEVWDNLHAARSALLDVLAGMGDADLAQHYPFPWSAEGTAYEWTAIILTHSRGHARELREFFAKE